MKSRMKRVLAGLLVLGITLWGPGIPLGFAQVEVDWNKAEPECRAAFEELRTLDPVLAAECTRILDTSVEVYKNPEAASPEAKAEAATVVGEVETIDKSLKTVANFETVKPDLLQTKLTQTAGVDPKLAAEIAKQHTELLEKAKAACATGQVFDAERMVAQVQELYTKAGIDAKAVLDGMNRDHGVLSFERVVVGSFEGPVGGLGAPDFVGGGINVARECYVTCDLLQRGGFDFQGGAPPSIEQMQKTIDGMNVSTEEKAKMIEMAKAYEGFCREGNFAAIAEIQRENAIQAYKEWQESGGVMPSGTVMTPEMVQMMEHGAMGTAMTPELAAAMAAEHGVVFTPEMAAMAEHYGMAMDPHTWEATSGTSSGGTTTDTSGGTTHATENPNYDNTQQYNFDHTCVGLSAAEKETHKAHNHCLNEP